MDPVTLLLIAGLGSGVWWMRKYEPSKLPKFLQPAPSVMKAAAVQRVVATSVPTPVASAGLDPGMTSAQVQAANVLLAAGTDSAAMYQMASDYSALGYVNTAKALIAKADAITAAKSEGASDQEILSQMMAVCSTSAGGS
ncbi:MAG: hypothetical protein ACYCPT_01965 [Acidimicrobiales bacterium]